MARSDYQVGSLRLSVQQQMVYRDDIPVPLPPIAFNILLVLVEKAGEVVSREALRERIWPDSFVEGDGLSKNISVLRTTLRPHLAEEEFIRTWSKRGYQLLLPVTEIASEVEPEATAEALPSSADVSLAVPGAGEATLYIDSPEIAAGSTKLGRTPAGGVPRGAVWILLVVLAAAGRASGFQAVEPAAPVPPGAVARGAAYARAGS